MAAKAKRKVKRDIVVIEQLEQLSGILLTSHAEAYKGSRKVSAELMVLMLCRLIHHMHGKKHLAYTLHELERHSARFRKMVSERRWHPERDRELAALAAAEAEAAA